MAQLFSSINIAFKPKIRNDPEYVTVVLEGNNSSNP